MLRMWPVTSHVTASTNLKMRDRRGLRLVVGYHSVPAGGPGRSHEDGGRRPLLDPERISRTVGGVARKIRQNNHWTTGSKAS
jgi:hypothetical protein